MNLVFSRVFRKPSKIKLKTALIWGALIILSLAPIFPLSNFVGHPHWDNIRWIPFQDFSFSVGILKDVAGNTLWFMIFGYLLQHQLYNRSPSIRSVGMVSLIAIGLSLFIEFFQVFCHNRIPSTTDVIFDTIGASLGGYFANTHRSLPLAQSVCQPANENDES